jgi:aspartate-semialdehyde dehydrogenase
MTPVSGSAAGTARVAVVGSTTTHGTRVRQMLAESGVPGDRVELYSAADASEPILSEYDGEARLIQTPDLDELLSRDVVFLCETGELVARVVDRAASSTAAIDVANVRTGRANATLVHMDINPRAAAGPHGLFAVPHDVSTLLADLLYPLDRELGLAEVVATVLRPASDFGEQAIEELRDQTVRLLNFAEPVADVFGRQLAFNVLPQAVSPDGSESIEARVATEVGSLLGWLDRRMTVGLAVAPVFFGHSLSLWLRFGRDLTVDRLREVLMNAGLSSTTDSGSERTTPMDVATEDGIHVSGVRDDERGGFQLWAVAGGVHRRNAELAVRLAAALSEL